MQDQGIHQISLILRQIQAEPEDSEFSRSVGSPSGVSNSDNSRQVLSAYYIHPGPVLELSFIPQILSQ